MAQLKSTVVAGSLRVTDTTYTNDLVVSGSKTARHALIAPTSDGAPTWRALTNADVGLGNVENTKLSTWAGTSNITKVGTIASGTWQGTAVALAYGGTGTNNTAIAINKVFAGPASGSAGNASFRALVAADIPGITTAADTSNELYMLGVTSSATTAIKYNSGVKAKNGAVTATTYNGLTLTKETTGFKIAGGTTSKTLTVEESITLKAGSNTYLAYYNGANILQSHGLAHFSDTYTASTKNGKNELVLGNSTVSTSNGSAYGQLALYSENVAGTYLKSASGTAWKTATLPAATGMLAMIENSTAKGSDTKPVKVAATGLITECSTYAGGTAVTLNGTSKAASTASFFAPTVGGTAEQILIGGGSNAAPVWSEAMSLYGSNVNSWSAKFNGKMIGNSAHNYGTALPTSGETGQIFFQLSDPVYELPLTGAAGTFLKKVNADTRAAQWSNWTTSDIWSATSDPYNGAAPNYDTTATDFSLVGTKHDFGIVAMYSTAASAGIKIQKSAEASRFFMKVEDNGIWTYSDFFIIPHTVDKGTQPASSQVRRFNFSSHTISSGNYYQNANTIGNVECVVQSDNTTYVGLSVFENVASSTNQAYFRVNYAYTGVKMSTTNCKIYGAVWNDYAEFRRDNQYEKGKQKPGNCVVETGTGTLALSTMRLQRGAEIITDTFGFAIGQDDNHNANTPVAVSGRVLAYPYESREEFRKNIGKPVCSGPNGTVSIMTQFEERTYPSRIIGTISEVPTYKEWGEDNIKVDGRVWIRMR